MAVEWTKTVLGAVVDPSRRVTYGIVQPGPRQEHGTPIIRGKDYSNGRVDDRDLYRVLPEIAAKYQRSTVKADDILFSIVGYLGQVALVPPHLEGANITQTTARIAIAPPNLPLFFFHQLGAPTFKKQVERFTKGSAQPGLNLADVVKMEVIVPPPLEQKKIAAVLSSVDDVMEKTEAVIDQLQLVKKSLMQELLTRGLPGRHTRFKMTEVGEVPEEWEVVPLARVSTKISDGEHLSPQLIDTGRPLLSAKHIREAGVLYEDVSYVSEEDFTRFRRRCDPSPGDVLIVSRGATIGRVLFLADMPQPFCLMGSVIQVRTEAVALDGGFLAQFLALEGSRRELVRTSGSSAQQAIYLRHLKNMLVAVPPLDEQRRIAAALTAFDARVRAEARTVEALRNLKSGMMSVLLTGEVRVNVDREVAA